MSYSHLQLTNLFCSFTFVHSLSCKNNHFIQTFSYSTLQFWTRKSTYIRTRNSYKLFSVYLPKLGYYYYSSIRNIFFVSYVSYPWSYIKPNKIICSKILEFKELGASILSWDGYKSNHRFIDNNLGGTLLIPPWNLFLIVVLFQARLSTEREVVLDNVDFTTTGQYRCEVSGDAPMFQTASTEGILYVVGEYLSLRNGCVCACKT